MDIKIDTSALTTQTVHGAHPVTAVDGHVDEVKPATRDPDNTLHPAVPAPKN